MPTFEETCVLELARTARNRLFVSAVVRLNRDNGHVHKVTNEEYGQGNPGGQGGRFRVAAQQIGPFQASESMDELLDTMPYRRNQREIAWLRRLPDVSDHSFELQMKLREDAKIGIMPDEGWKAYRLAQIREAHRQRLAPQIQKLDLGAGQYQEDRFRARQQYERLFDQEFRANHGHGQAYPPENIGQVQLHGEGGHAEELLIREWDSMCYGVGPLTDVELFITRTPCATNSSGFVATVSGQQVTFKQGCITKLIQLVELVGGGVNWTIWYYGYTAGTEYELACYFARKFPRRVRYQRGIPLPRYHDG